MHKVYTSYFDNIKNGIGIRISVSRFPPKSKKVKVNLINHWLYNLAPSAKLLNNYKKGNITWEEYTEEYLKETKTVDFMEDLMILLKLLKENDVTLYCFEPPNQNCHRHLLGELLKKLGYEVKEI